MAGLDRRVTWTGPRRRPGRSPTRTEQAQALADLARGGGAGGDLDRAEATGRAITDPDRQAQALAGLAEAAARAGDLDRAKALAEQAEAAARAITDPDRQAQALAGLAQAAAAGG